VHAHGPGALAERLAERDAALILVWNRERAASEGDDPYAEFKVPDDLMW
jgi:uncharacterized protein YaiL (DUF2058 family)